jgi:hypothetical protein
MAIALVMAGSVSCSDGDSDPRSGEPAESGDPDADAFLRVRDQRTPGDTLVIDDLVLPEGGGFVAVYQDGSGAPGELLATSQHLGAGDHADVELELDQTLDADGQVWIMAHGDEGDDAFDVERDTPLTSGGAVVVVPVALTLDAR